MAWEEEMELKTDRQATTRRHPHNAENCQRIGERAKRVTWTDNDRGRSSDARGWGERGREKRTARCSGISICSVQLNSSTGKNSSTQEFLEGNKLGSLTRQAKGVTERPVVVGPQLDK